MPEEAPGWSIVVDRECCMGSGVCVMYAPGTFAHDDQAKAIVPRPQREARGTGDPSNVIRS